jgi:cytochrome c oxidase subunit II
VSFFSVPSRPARWLLAVALLSACSTSPNVMQPVGEGANQIANLGWLMFGIAAVVYVVVMAMLAGSLWRRRDPAASSIPTVQPPPAGGRRFILVSGVVIPTIILVGVFAANVHTLYWLSAPNAQADVRIDVIGQRWWWEVHYPDHGFVTANEIYIPTGQRVEIRLMSEDVIHSLWIPDLNGKADMIPGQTNSLWLYTETEGQYRGQCAEYCGMQHAWMVFFVIAVSPGDFEAWVAGQQQDAPEPQDALVQRGQQIFLGSSCVYCHTIRGTNATGVIGPDLTHFASRLTIGAGAADNTRANLAGWIVDPHSFKPGNRMPPMYIEGDDLQALLAYMETLR